MTTSTSTATVCDCSISVATDLLILDDLGDEVAWAQVVRNGHPDSQDAHVGKALEQLQSNRRPVTDTHAHVQRGRTAHYPGWPSGAQQPTTSISNGQTLPSGRQKLRYCNCRYYRNSSSGIVDIGHCRQVVCVDVPCHVAPP